jgi:hypothetical protein
MIWEDERYVRVYTRDTPEWLSLSFDAQALFLLLLRKVDRAGLVRLGKLGVRAVAIITGHATHWERLGPALDELLNDGCVEIHGDTLVVPNFIEAQETPQSDRLRKAESRARVRDRAREAGPNFYPPVTKRDEMSRNVPNESQNVTKSHERSHGVTRGHTRSPFTVPCLTVPNHAVPNCAVPTSKDLASQDLQKPRKRKPKPEVDPRFAPLRVAWEKAFTAQTGEAYRWQGAKDAKAIHSLIAVPPEEFDRRARKGVAASGWPHCASPAQLAAKWNDLAGNSGNPKLCFAPAQQHYEFKDGEVDIETGELKGVEQ